MARKNHHHEKASPQTWASLDKASLWHPFTPMRPWIDRSDPAELIIERGEGFELINVRGERFIDGVSSLWCNLHGHRVPRIDDAIRAQLDKIAHSTLLGLASPPSIELADRLVNIAPAGLEKVFFSDSGATAVEVALKMAFQYYRNLGRNKRRRFLALREGYHGDTIGAMSVGGIGPFGEVFAPLLFETTLVDSPNGYRHPAGAEAGSVVLDQVNRALSAAPGEYCAVVIEPLIQGAGGMLTHPPGFLAGVRELTRTHDVLLIADEVATGFCRTGRLFACDRERVSPDLMTVGKGLTGGYLPVAATLATQRIFDSFCGAFYHGHTFTGNALGCAAAVASIDLIAGSGLPDALPEKVKRIGRRLGELADHPQVGDIRQCGMMVGIELVRDRRRKTPFDAGLRIGAAVCDHARRHSVIIRPLGDVVVLMPAPAMDNETLERLLTAVIESIHEYFRKNPV